MITNSDINGLSTFHATFPAFLYARLTGYITSSNKVDGKLTNYQGGSASFTMENKYQKAWHFSAHLLPLLIYLFIFNQIDVFACFVYDEDK